MSNISVLTDSLAGLPAELINQYAIKIIPGILTINGKNYRDNIDITPDEFWRIFPSIKTFVTTAPSPGDFVKFFQEAGKTSSDIIFIATSKQMSAIYQSAGSALEILKSENPDLHVQVIDSKYAVGAMGFIVIEAQRAVEAGKTLEEVLRVIQDMIGRVKSIAGTESLRYLIRSGRAPKSAYIGELLGIKPLVGMVSGNGLAESLGTARGKERCFQKLVEMIADYADASQPLHAMVQYTNSLADGQRLLQMVKDKYHCAELYIAPYTPIIAGHSGPINSIAFYF
jgi:DegV family protein with EDD domain